MEKQGRGTRGWTAALVVSFLASAGCASDTSSAGGDGVELSRAELSAELGPEGGLLEGAQGSELAGVRLEIPAGALAERVTVRMRRASPLPILPDAAEGVGPAFELEPAGLKLGRVARLTLPVVPDTREVYDEAAENCKVWQYADDAWQRLDNVDSSDASVTVEVTSLEPALAGVVVAPRPVSGTRGASCEGLSDTRCMPLSCTTPGAYCVETLTSVKAKSPLAVFGGKLFYQEAQSAGGRHARFDLDTRTLSRFTNQGCQLGDLNGDTTNQFVGDGLGNAWRRTCQLDFGARTTRFVSLPNITSGAAQGFPQFASHVVARSDGQVTILGQVIGGPAGGRAYLNLMGAAGATTSTTELARFKGGNVSVAGQVVADPDSPSALWLLGLANAVPNGLGVPFPNLGAIINLDAKGKLLRVIEDSEERRLIDVGSDGQFVQLIPHRLLAVRDGRVIADTVVEKPGGVPRQERLYTIEPALDELPPSGVPLPSLKEREGFADAIDNRIQAGGLAAVDDAGGVWAVVTTRIAGVSVNRSRLVHFAPEGGKPSVLDSDARIQQVLAASAGRIVVRAIPAGATEAEVFVIRRVE